MHRDGEGTDWEAGLDGVENRVTVKLQDEEKGGGVDGLGMLKLGLSALAAA